MLLSLRHTLTMNNNIKGFNSTKIFLLDKTIIDNNISPRKIYIQYAKEVGEGENNIVGNSTENEGGSMRLVGEDRLVLLLDHSQLGTSSKFHHHFYLFIIENMINKELAQKVGKLDPAYYNLKSITLFPNFTHHHRKVQPK